MSQENTASPRVAAMSDVAERKTIAVARRRRQRQARQTRRREVRACFWTRPIGHRYEVPESLSGMQTGGMETDGRYEHMRCVGCGKPFQLGRYGSSPSARPGSA